MQAPLFVNKCSYSYVRQWANRSAPLSNSVYTQHNKKQVITVKEKKKWAFITGKQFIH